MPKAYLGSQILIVDLTMSALKENHVTEFSVLERPLSRSFGVKQFAPHESYGWLYLHLE